jgi:hypothetical protein
MDKRPLTSADITIPGLYVDNEDDVWIKRVDKKLRLLTVYAELAKKEDRYGIDPKDYEFTELYLFAQDHGF